MDEQKVLLAKILESLEIMNARMDAGFKDLSAQLRSYERRLRAVEYALSDLEATVEKEH